MNYSGKIMKSIWMKIQRKNVNTFSGQLIQIFSNERRPKLFSNGSQHHLFVNGRQPQFFLSFELSSKYCKVNIVKFR